MTEILTGTLNESGHPVVSFVQCLSVNVSRTEYDKNLSKEVDGTLIRVRPDNLLHPVYPVSGSSGTGCRVVGGLGTHSGDLR